MTLSAMRTLVRRDLKDEDSSSYRWQDTEIDRALLKAIAELSRYIPRQMRATIATTPGSRSISMSALSDIVSIDRIEFLIDKHPRQFQRFAIYMETLTLTGGIEGDGTNCYVYWSRIHTLDATTNSVPAYLHDILALGAAAYAVLSQTQYRTDTAGFGGEQADRDYQTWGDRMLREFTRQLKRFGRGRNLKISQFYQGDDIE